MYIHEPAIPAAKNLYICWIDIMGTKEKMSNSVRTCSIQILHLHAAINMCRAQLQPDEKVYLYPIMDGAYVVAENPQVMLKFVTTLCQTMADDFLDERSTNEQKFLFKGAIAYGPLVQGKEINIRVHETFNTNEDYLRSLLFGLPMIQANQAEKLAPPFGIYIHESCRAFFPEGYEPIVYKWHRWWNGYSNFQTFKNKFAAYYGYLRSQYISQNYDLDRLKTHYEMAREYFGITQDID